VDSSEPAAVLGDGGNHRNSQDRRIGNTRRHGRDASNAGNRR
jgi:hypothetical protein